ncbi:MAG: TonB C-terminal domain-containing protein [Bacteriovoracia bacterium]
MSSSALRPLDTPADPNSRLSRGLRWSFILHALFLAVVFVKTVVLPDNFEVYTPTLRVDLVGLPDILSKDLDKVSPIVPKEDAGDDMKAPAEQKIKTGDMTLKEQEKKKKATQEAEAKKRKSKMSNALERIKALAKLSEEEPKNQALIKGNQVSKGTTLTGNAKEAANLSYNDLLLERLKQNWELPVWLDRQNLSAKVLLYIDARGSVRGIRFEKNSGNPKFDAAVRDAITASDPFPVPPKELQSQMMSSGVLLGFPL